MKRKAIEIKKKKNVYTGITKYTEPIDGKFTKNMETKNS